MRGRYNFERLRYEYYRDRVAAFEAFKKGAMTFREEFTSRIWARDYDFPALTEKRVVRDIVPDRSPSGSQGWFMNLRHPWKQRHSTRTAGRSPSSSRPARIPSPA
jgi:microcin C transport system substrate-binding protein